MFDKLRERWLRDYEKGQEAVSQEVDAKLFEEERALLERTADVATETIDLVDKLASDGNPHKQRLAALIKDRVVDAVEQVTTARQQVEEARGAAIKADPFSVSLRNASTSLPNTETSLPSSSMKALPHELQEPPKPKRGRPRKNSKG